MKFLLIIFYISNGVAIGEFEDHKACDYAKTQVEERGLRARAFCVPKSSNPPPKGIHG